MTESIWCALEPLVQNCSSCDEDFDSELAHTNSTRSASVRPDSASPMVSYLNVQQNGQEVCEVVLVGTSHVSERSAQEVTQIIREHKPDVVFVELCEKRADRLRNRAGPAGASMKDVERYSLPSFGEFLRYFGNRSFGSLLVEMSLAEQFKVMEMLGFETGKEMKMAMGLADETGAKLVCGDVPINETTEKMSHATRSEWEMFQKHAAAPACPACQNLMIWSNHAEGAYEQGWHCEHFKTCGSRTANQGEWRWFCEQCSFDLCSPCCKADSNVTIGVSYKAGVSLSREGRLTCSLTRTLKDPNNSLPHIKAALEAENEGRKERQVLRRQREAMQKMAPNIYQAFVADRDEFMSRMLISAGGRKVVAVVGANHLDGTEKHWLNFQNCNAAFVESITGHAA